MSVLIRIYLLANIIQDQIPCRHLTESVHWEERKVLLWKVLFWKSQHQRQIAIYLQTSFVTSPHKILHRCSVFKLLSVPPIMSSLTCYCCTSQVYIWQHTVERVCWHTGRCAEVCLCVSECVCLREREICVYMFVHACIICWHVAVTFVCEPVWWKHCQQQCLILQTVESSPVNMPTLNEYQINKRSW